MKLIADTIVEHLAWLADMPECRHIDKIEYVEVPSEFPRCFSEWYQYPHIHDTDRVAVADVYADKLVSLKMSYVRMDRKQFNGAQWLPKEHKDNFREFSIFMGRCDQCKTLFVSVPWNVRDEKVFRAWPDPV